VPQIRLHLEVGIEREGWIVAILKTPAEFSVHCRVGQISDVRGHPRHREPAARVGAFGEIATTAPVGIGHDRLASDLVEGDVLSRVPRRCSDRQGGEYPRRIARGPLQYLHATHRAARNRKQRLDADMIQEHRLGAHHVAHRDDRKVEAPRHAARWIG
jgi:hypothetical protein